MGNLSPQQLYALARKVGFPPDQATVAGSIAMAESSGNPDAESPNPGGAGCVNVGLWQLATPCGLGHGYSVAQLKDPVTNAEVTYARSGHGRNWSAWETYQNGAYQAHLTAVQGGQQKEASGTPWWKFIGDLATGNAAGIGSDIASGVSIPGISGIERVGAVLEAFYTALTDVKMWRSLGWIFIGFAVLVMAIVFFFRKQIEEGIGTVGGAAVKAV